MSHTILKSAATLVLAGVIFGSIPVPEVHAQSRSSWRSNYWNSNEGHIEDEEEERATSRRGMSSAVQKKINNLDDDEVEEFPIPILLGLSLRAITSDFGDPRGGGTREHEGQDLLAPRGAYIVSPTEAVVTRTGTGSSAGKYVYTANPGGETFVYMHLDDIADGIKSGTELEPGDLIGYVGDTGNAKGGVTHLHFEVREGRRATDPFPRLVREFTQNERLDALEQIIKDADDEEEEVEKIVSLYRSFLVSARASGATLPEELAEALGTAPVATTGGGVRDLDLGSQGDDVTVLQVRLIAENAGPKARALATAGATGYFGSITQAALAEYQVKAGITPAAGYYGPKTRAQLALQTSS